MLKNQTNNFPTENNSISAETTNPRHGSHAQRQAILLGESQEMITFLDMYQGETRERIISTISSLLSFQRSQEKHYECIVEPVTHDVEFLVHLLNAFSSVDDHPITNP